MANFYRVGYSDGEIRKITSDELKAIAGGAKTIREAVDAICSREDGDAEMICFSYSEAKEISRNIRERYQR